MPDMITLKIGNKTYDIRDSRIGNLADLNTTDKDSVVDAINETLTRTGPTDQQVQDAVDEYLSNHPTVTGTFSNEAKNALLTLLEKVAYAVSDGQTYLGALRTELFRINVDSISAVFTQGSAVIYTTDSLDTLKQYLVVTANYSDGSSQTVTSYSLSGTLSVGTSIITVEYGGKTATFSVEVTTALDSIAFGSLTYRDLFITNNEIVIGDFETTLSLSSTEVSLGNGRTYKINAGSPAQTAEESDSPTHSLKCFGSSSTQILYRNAEKVFATGNYLVCVSAKVTRYAAGYAGVQAAWPKDLPSKFGGNVGFQRTTNGFEHLAIIYTLDSTTANRTGLRFYIGSFLSANLDCYVDDVICTPVPSAMTEAQGLALYEQYLHILREGL